jgi:hypothetical protein
MNRAVGTLLGQPVRGFVLRSRIKAAPGAKFAISRLQTTFPQVTSPAVYGWVAATTIRVGRFSVLILELQKAKASREGR